MVDFIFKDNILPCYVERVIRALTALRFQQLIVQVSIQCSRYHSLYTCMCILRSVHSSSQWLVAYSSVPYGSITGAILLLVYINDVSKWLSHSSLSRGQDSALCHWCTSLQTDQQFWQSTSWYSFHCSLDNWQWTQRVCSFLADMTQLITHLHFIWMDHWSTHLNS